MTEPNVESDDDAVEGNRRILDRLRDEVGVIDISREEIRRAIDEDRAERETQFDRIDEERRRGGQSSR